MQKALEIRIGKVAIFCDLVLLAGPAVVAGSRLPRDSVHVVTQVTKMSEAVSRTL